MADAIELIQLRGVGGVDIDFFAGSEFAGREGKETTQEKGRQQTTVWITRSFVPDDGRGPDPDRRHRGADGNYGDQRGGVGHE